MPLLKNPKHEAFAQFVTEGQPLSRAYVTAGYLESDANACNLAKRPDVDRRIQELHRIKSAAAAVTPNRILAELARLGFNDITEAINVKRGKVRIKDTDTLDPDLRAAIAEIRQSRDGVAVKFHDKVAALTAMGKHLGMFKENLDVSLNVSLADLVNGSYELERKGILPAPQVIEGKANEQPDTSAPADMVTAEPKQETEGNQ